MHCMHKQWKPKRAAYYYMKWALTVKKRKEKNCQGLAVLFFFDRIDKFLDAIVIYNDINDKYSYI